MWRGDSPLPGILHRRGDAVEAQQQGMPERFASVLVSPAPPFHQFALGEFEDIRVRVPDANEVTDRRILFQWLVDPGDIGEDRRCRS
jgi:hypothetical protein